jgi:lysozyme
MCRITASGLNLIKEFEGFKSLPYQDGKGIWTIGYGHINGVTAETALITEAEAERLLLDDLHEAESQISRLIQVPLNDNQYSALVSLVFNVGNAPLHRTLGQMLNAGNYAAAAEEFSKWVFIGEQPSAGLIRRRAAEKKLFQS